MRACKNAARKLAAAASLAMLVLVLATQTGCEQAQSNVAAGGKASAQMLALIPTILR